MSTDLISIIREFLKLKALAQVPTVAMRVRLIVTHVRATPLGRMDHACQTRNKVSVQLAGVGRLLVLLRYIGEYGCGKEPVLLLLYPGIIHSLSNLMGQYCGLPKTTFIVIQTFVIRQNN